MGYPPAQRGRKLMDWDAAVMALSISRVREQFLLIKTP